MHWHDPDIQPVRVVYCLGFETADKSRRLFILRLFEAFGAADELWVFNGLRVFNAVILDAVLPCIFGYIIQSNVSSFVW